MQDTILEASVGVHEKYQDVEWGGRMNVEKEKRFQEIDLGQETSVPRAALGVCSMI